MIYFDYNSTTPIDPRVLEKMMPYLTNQFANASSAHHFGISTKKAVEDSRKQVAELIGATSNEIVFTSGATEAINIAIKGIAQIYSSKGNHIVTVSTEHKAVLDTCKYLETIGYEVTYLPVKSDGLLDLDLVRNSIRTDTILVSVMHVNNETGVIQPIKQISDLAHEKGAIFMSDCTQSVGKIPVNVVELGIDILSLSAHKIYGPKGIGALYLKKGIKKIPSQIHGGGHEQGLRSGTLNVPGIVGLGKACEIAKEEMIQNEKKIKELRDSLEKKLLTIKGSKVNGSLDSRVFNVTNILFPNLNANILIEKLKNIAISNGSACSSAIYSPSHVLTSMGLREDEAYSSIRFSLGKLNTIDDINDLCKFLNKELKKL
ncbi:cysteine desulfurase [Algoriphagus kandeliae]|uniref:cysteine desulfurase n=1 Tax=Algoriphagus kandeliae TaxID=2562278 RepID=A0A4Y9QR76_9BACT|nr:cysteine desulfurase [Algoriphagus kandeliae]